MYIDSCRRFTLGATIENTLMKLWVYNRSIIIASEPFDFNTVWLIDFLYPSLLTLYVTGARDTFSDVSRQVSRRFFLPVALS